MSNAKRLNKDVARLMTAVDGGRYGTGYAARVIKEAQASDPVTWDSTPWFKRTEWVIDFWLANYSKED